MVFWCCINLLCTHPDTEKISNSLYEVGLYKYCLVFFGLCFHKNLSLNALAIMVPGYLCTEEARGESSTTFQNGSCSFCSDAKQIAPESTPLQFPSHPLLLSGTPDCVNFKHNLINLSTFIYIYILFFVCEVVNYKMSWRIVNSLTI